MSIHCNYEKKESYDKQMILDNRYIIKKRIGKGLTSQVFQVLDTFTNEIKAAKIFNDNHFTIFTKEEKILQRISKFNIKSNIKLYDSGIGPLTKDVITAQKMYFILEFGSKGTLFDQIERTSNGFSESVCKYIFYEIIKAVSAFIKKEFVIEK